MSVPHLEVMQRELQTTQDLIIEDHNLSVANSLIDLATRLQLQIRQQEPLGIMHCP